MQSELTNNGFEIRILGVNQKGYNSGDEMITAGRKLPWLKEIADQDVWGEWNVAYRDVVILDEENNVLNVFNLTVNDLSDEDTYNELKALLEAATQ